jgi:hypothetical protein
MKVPNIQTKIIGQTMSTDSIAEDACRHVYTNLGGGEVPTSELVRQTAAWMVDRHNVQYGEALAACRKWMFTEELIAENYSAKEISRLRANRWMEKQIDLHDRYLIEISNQLKK